MIHGLETRTAGLIHLLWATIPKAFIPDNDLWLTLLLSIFLIILALFARCWVRVGECHENSKRSGIKYTLHLYHDKPALG